MRRKKGKRCRRDQKKKRRGGSCREKQRSLERAAARRKRDVAFEGRASKKRDYSWNSRVSYSDFLIAKIMTSWPRRFLSLDVSVGGFRLRGNTRRREDEKGRGRVCFVVGETIFRTNGARGGRWRGSRFAGNVKGFMKEFLEDSYEIYIWRRRRMIAWRMRARSWTGHGVTLEIDADNEIMHESTILTGNNAMFQGWNNRWSSILPLSVR